MRDTLEIEPGADQQHWLRDKSVDPAAANGIVAELAQGPRLTPRKDAPAEAPARAVARAKRPPRFDISKMERAIDLRRLRYFVQIVADGSFSTAAQRVHVAQPALSHHVRELEAILGVSLLTRSAHGVAPTEAGQCLYEHGVTILGRVRDAAVEVSEFGVDSHRRVVVGLDTSVASLLAAPLVEGMRHSASDIDLVIEEGASERLAHRIETKELDIALIYDAAGKRMLTAQPLLTDSLYLVGPYSANGSDITFEQVAQLPLILPRRPHRIRERLEEQAHALPAQLNVVMEIDSVSSIKRLIRAGLGYSVLAASDFFDEHRMALLDRRLIVRPHLEQTLFLCHLTGGQLSNSATQARRLVLAVIENLLGSATWPGRSVDAQDEPVVRHVAYG